MNKTAKIILTSTMMGIATAACAVCMSQTAYASSTDASSANGSSVSASNTNVRNTTGNNTENNNSVKTNTPPHTNFANQNTLENSDKNSNNKSEDNKASENKTKNNKISDNKTEDNKTNPSYEVKNTLDNKNAESNSTSSNKSEANTAINSKLENRSAKTTEDSDSQEETVSYPQMTVVEPGVEVTIKPKFMRGSKEITLEESKKYGPCRDNYEYIRVEYKDGDKYKLAYGSAITRSSDYSYTFKWRTVAANEHPNATIQVTGLRMYDKEGHQLQEEVIPTFRTKDADKHKPEPKPFEFNRNELSAGLATDKSGNYVRWRVLSNNDSPSIDEQEYCSKFLDYDPDAHILKTKIIDNTVPPINNRAPSVVAKRFIGITLQTMGMNDTVPVTENLKNTPWFFKDAKEKADFENALHNKVWSKQYNYDQYRILQQIGGKLPKGVKYNLNTRAFEGNPEINDWQENETMREYPLYLAQVTMYNTADYLTLKPYTSYIVSKPKSQPKHDEAQNFSDTPANVVSTGLSSDKKLRWRILSDDLPKGIDKSKVTYNSATKRFEPLYYEGLSKDPGVIAQVSNLTLETIDANGHTTKYQKTPVFVYKNEDSHKKVLVIYDTKKRIGDGTLETSAGSFNYIAAGDLPNGVSFDAETCTFSGTAKITDWKKDETSRTYPIYVATYKRLNGTMFLHFVDDSITIVRNTDGKITPVTPSPVVPPTPQPPVPPQPQPQTSDTAANVLASGTATKDGKQIQWQVINNDKNSDTSQMKMYAQYLSYNPDTNALTMTDAAAFTENGKAISARKFSNITLKIKKDGKTTEENIKETPWFFKDQNSKNMWDSINQTPIGTQTFEKYSLEQKIGGAGLEGLSYDFLNKNFDGKPTIAWSGDEKIREIPVYMASIHKGKDGSDYMTVGELKKFKAYKDRNDIFIGTAGTNQRTKQPYKFDDLGLNNVTQTVIGEYNSGTYGIPFYIKPGETKTIKLRFYLLNDKRQPIQEITDEFMKVLNPEPREVRLKKVQLFRKNKTTVIEMNTEYTLNTDYSITFTANADAQDGDSYNTYGSKLDGLSPIFDPNATPTYTYEDGITLHEKNHPENISLIKNVVIRVTKPKSQPPKPEPPKPEPPKPEPEPTPVTPEPKPTPVPIPEPEPIPVPIIPAPEPEEVTEPEPETEPEPMQEETVEEAQTPQTHEPLASTGSETSNIAGAGLAFLLSAFGAFSLKRTRIGRHSK